MITTKNEQLTIWDLTDTGLKYDNYKAQFMRFVNANNKDMMSL